MDLSVLILHPKSPTLSRGDDLALDSMSTSKLPRGNGNKSDFKNCTFAVDDELNPMEPSSCSYAPHGGWVAGKEGVQPRAADTTATGPLFQQRPDHSPFSVLMENAETAVQFKNPNSHGIDDADILPVMIKSWGKWYSFMDFVGTGFCISKAMSGLLRLSDPPKLMRGL